MVEADGVSTLASLHRQLIDALAYLDRTGRHAAAAHLVAAIELLEDDLDSAAGSGSETSIAVIARRMVEGFGSRAQAVARAQLADATGPAMLAWAAIVNRIP